MNYFKEMFAFCTVGKVALKPLEHNRCPSLARLHLFQLKCQHKKIERVRQKFGLSIVGTFLFYKHFSSTTHYWIGFLIKEVVFAWEIINKRLPKTIRPLFRGISLGFRLGESVKDRWVMDRSR